jgi:hypothetical protein
MGRRFELVVDYESAPLRWRTVNAVGDRAIERELHLYFRRQPFGHVEAEVVARWFSAATKSASVS